LIVASFGIAPPGLILVSRPFSFGLLVELSRLFSLRARFFAPVLLTLSQRVFLVIP
jgi:hypothetical protein